MISPTLPLASLSEAIQCGSALEMLASVVLLLPVTVMIPLFTGNTSRTEKFHAS